MQSPRMATQRSRQQRQRQALACGGLRMSASKAQPSAPRCPPAARRTRLLHVLPCCCCRAGRPAGQQPRSAASGSRCACELARGSRALRCSAAAAAAKPVGRAQHRAGAIAPACSVAVQTDALPNSHNKSCLVCRSPATRLQQQQQPTGVLRAYEPGSEPPVRAGSMPTRPYGACVALRSLLRAVLPDARPLRHTAFHGAERAEQPSQARGTPSTHEPSASQLLTPPSAPRRRMSRSCRSPPSAARWR
jgi:hypothetical protein